jgi:hypothetical protein
MLLLPQYLSVIKPARKSGAKPPLNPPPALKNTARGRGPLELIGLRDRALLGLMGYTFARQCHRYAAAGGIIFWRAALSRKIVLDLGA